MRDMENTLCSPAVRKYEHSRQPAAPNHSLKSWTNLARHPTSQCEKVTRSLSSKTHWPYKVQLGKIVWEKILGKPFKPRVKKRVKGVGILIF